MCYQKEKTNTFIATISQLYYCKSNRIWYTALMLIHRLYVHACTVDKSKITDLSNTVMSTLEWTVDV